MQSLQGKSGGEHSDPSQTAWVRIPACCVTLGKPLHFISLHLSFLFLFFIFKMADFMTAVYIICKTDLGSNPGSATK